MSTADEYGPEHGGDDILAAEYVLGVLPDDERQRAARRIDADAAFARLVDAWEVRLAPMASSFEAVEPPVSVKAAIDRRLFSQASNTTPREHSGRGFWQSLALWRGLTAAAALAAIVAIAVPMMTSPEPDQRFVVSMAHEGSDVHYYAVYDAKTQDVALSHVAGERPEGRDFELWVIEGENAPVSMGVIPAGSNVHMAVTSAARAKIESGAVFAITAEPSGGSPSGAPTGPIVAAGGLTNI